MHHYNCRRLLAVLLLGCVSVPSYSRPTPGQNSSDTTLNNAASTANTTSTSSSSSSTTTSSSSSRNSNAGPSQKRMPVIIDQDGGVEDLVATMLLMLNPRVDLLMVSYLEADSIKDVAVNTTLKLMHFLNITHIPLAVSTLPTKNPFPLMYRALPFANDVLPVLNPLDLNMDQLRSKVVPQQPGQDALMELLLKQKEPVIIVATGPLTNIAYALTKDPSVADKVAHIWWMGGTLRHPGNIFNNQSKNGGKAEWNVFADPAAAAVVWESKVPLTLIPLDATNKVPITPELLYKFGKQQNSRLSQLVGEMYAPTVTWVYLSPHDPYYAWDSLAAACLLQPNICKMQQEAVSVVLDGKYPGTLELRPLNSSSSSSSIGGSDSSNLSSGSSQSRDGNNAGSSSNRSDAVGMSKPKRVSAAVDADADAFDACILNAFASR